MNPVPSAFEELVETVRRLRAPGGCPWDREQTHRSLRPYLIEEAHEALEILDQVADDAETLKSATLRESLVEELGDVLMQVMIHSEIASEHGHFAVEDVVRRLQEKLVTRHPHVFGEEKAASVSEALLNWEKRKAEEKARKKSDASILDGLPKGLPSLQRAVRMSEKVSQTGFRWKGAIEALEKAEEEIRELRHAIENAPQGDPSITEELGDTLLALSTLAFHLKLQPEDALREALAKFEGRFRALEGKLKTLGQKTDAIDPVELQALWNETKRGAGSP